MWRMVVRMNGVPLQTLHLILTIWNMEQVNRLCIMFAEDVELVGGEGEPKAPWVEVKANIHKAT